MGRHAQVFVRQFADEEGQRLVRVTRRSTDPVRMRRAIVVLASAQGRSVPDTAALLRCTQPYVRDVIHAFNAQGFGALDPKWSGGRASAFDEPTKVHIVRIVLSRPQDLGEPFTCWSILKLRDYLIRTKVVAQISTGTLRQILRTRDVRFQRTKTWKQSNDLDYEAKKNRILELYDRAPDGSRVICVGEFGGVAPHLGAMSGRYLSFEEREELVLLRARGCGVREIARALHRSPSTISREMRATQRRAAGDWSIERSTRSGMRIGVRAVPRWRSWPPMMRFASMCRIG